MTPKAPKAGRRILLEHIGPLWRRMSFSWKVSARNILRYKRRFLMTVIGVSGCTALMLVGFGLHDAIWDIIDVQFGQIQRYDMTVSIARGLDDASAGRVRRTLVDGGAKHLTRVDARAMLAKGSGSDDLTYGTWYATAPAGQEACDRLADALRADRAVATVGYVQTTVGTYPTMLSAIDVIVVVLIVAAALAFIVLYDLTTIDIGERIREIATLKVLGFRRGEVDAYVFREVAVLVLIGALAGLGLGTWLEGFVVAGGIAAVVDGVTSKSMAGIWEPSGGVVAKRALCAALERLGSDEPPCDPADMRAVQRVLDGELRARYEHDRAAAAAGGIAYFRTHPVDRAEANAVVYSHGAGRIWLFGDCQAMVNGQAVDTVKTVDRLLGALRSFVVQAHDLAAEDSTRQQTGDGAADPGRAAIMPFLRMQNRFANTRGEFGYFVFDGFTDPTYPIRTLEARPGDEVVLASDGYPDLRPTLVESQAALEQLRRTDPRMLHVPGGTKGFDPLRGTYDDRTYLRFRVR